MSCCPCASNTESLALDVIGMGAHVHARDQYHVVGGYGLGAETVLAFPETYGGLITTPGSRSEVTLDFPYVGGGPSPVVMTANGQVINTRQNQAGFALPEMPDISPLLWVGGGIFALALLMRRGRR